MSDTKSWYKFKKWKHSWNGIEFISWICGANRRSLNQINSISLLFRMGREIESWLMIEELGGRRQQQSTSPLHNQSHQSTKRKTKSCLFFGLIENWFVGGAGLNAEWGRNREKKINLFSFWWSRQSKSTNSIFSSRLSGRRKIEFVYLGLPRGVGPLGAAFHSFHSCRVCSIDSMKFNWIEFLSSISQLALFVSFISLTN